jgi:putative phosphoesterase
MSATTRVVVFSDVHGNRVALDAVLEQMARLNPDHVICGGDLAFGGPDPEAAVTRIMTMGIPCIRGNTDEWLVPEAGDCEPITAWTRGRLSPASREYLRALPFEYRLDDLLVVHATPWSVSDVVPKDAGPAQLRRLLDEGRAAVVVYGHIHLGWIGRVPGGGLVVNSGSVGFPFDGDPRASYALLERTADGWSAVLHRVSYDVDRAAGRFPSDHPAPGAWAARMRSGRRG